MYFEKSRQRQGCPFLFLLSHLAMIVLSSAIGKENNGTQFSNYSVCCHVIGYVKYPKISHKKTTEDDKEAHAIQK